jgi:hypothetical protein
MEKKCLNKTPSIDLFGSCTEMVIIGAHPVAMSQLKTNMETTMNTAPVYDTAIARDALENALLRLERSVEEKSYETFGLRETRTPKTAQDIIDWIKNDEFIAPDTEDDDYDPEDYRYHDLKGIRFKPLKKKDREGYEKHMEAFRKDRNSLRLEIKVLEPEKALANFKKLEKEYLH